MADLPEFITFTGVDERTSFVGMHELSSLYPIEWGVLFSPKRQGSGRYPPLRFIEQLALRAGDFDLSAHLCGGDARDVIERGRGQHDDAISYAFDRSQINTADPDASPAWIAAWAGRLHVRAILQCRGAFPDVTCVDFLFDKSGGRGVTPKAWPANPTDDILRGYAGGINPANVAGITARLKGRYWIDMESGVRTDDVFDLDLCRQVCEAVYGKREARNG